MNTTLHYHYLLRMARTHPPETETFREQEVVDGYTMLREDLETYQASNPSSKRAASALSLLKKCQETVLTGAALGAMGSKYLKRYYADLTKDVLALKIDEKLILLGGPSHHAILHQFKRLSDSTFQIKTYNGDHPHNSRHILRSYVHYQTHILPDVPAKRITNTLMRNLFSHKFTKTKKPNDTIYDTLDKFQTSTPLSNDPATMHKAIQHKTCLRTAFLYWLKEDGLQGEYQAFKVAFGKKAVQNIADPALQALGKQRLAIWQNKVEKQRRNC